jgi:hypothetical protein
LHEFTRRWPRPGAALAGARRAIWASLDATTDQTRWRLLFVDEGAVGWRQREQLNALPALVGASSPDHLLVVRDRAPSPAVDGGGLSGVIEDHLGRGDSLGGVVYGDSPSAIELPDGPFGQAWLVIGPVGAGGSRLPGDASSGGVWWWLELGPDQLRVEIRAVEPDGERVRRGEARWTPTDGWMISDTE